MRHKPINLVGYDVPAPFRLRSALERQIHLNAKLAKKLQLGGRHDMLLVRKLEPGFEPVAALAKQADCKLVTGRFFPEERS